MNYENRIKQFLTTLSNRLPVWYETFKEKYQHRMLVFLFFILLSSIFWFIRALNETYEAKITYPIKYTKLPDDKVLSGELPRKLTLTVEANGFKIIMHQLHLNINALRFNVESFSLREAKNNSFYILTNQVKDYLAEDLENVKILKISPDTLFFHFVDVVTRKVGIHVVMRFPENFLAKQYALNGSISAIPDSIIVTGPQSLTDTLQCIYTKPLELYGLTDSTIKSVNLVDLKHLNYNVDKVKVEIPVDKYTETSVTASIVPINVPDSLIMKTFPGTVRITYRITLSNYDKVTPASFTPVVNYNDISQSLGGNLKVFLPDTPKYVFDVKINPGNVDFINELNVENRINRGDR